MPGISRVVPAILTDDPAALEMMVRQAETFTDYVQIDVMDGRFVPSRSITSEHISRLHLKLDWEAHLMVLNPEDHFEAYRNAGARKVVFHYEATGSPEMAIAIGRDLGLGVGLAINPETKVSDIVALGNKVDSVLFLSVNPGFYGAKFIPEVLDKIREFRKRFSNIETGIDGGMKESNIAQVAQSGADVIYVGSAIFLQPDPGASFRRLTALARQASG